MNTILLTGEYCKDAAIYAEIVESEAISQIMGLCNSPTAEEQIIRVMPDVHAGAGCTIGTTMTIGDKVIPNVCGVDLNCGMLVARIAEKEIDFEKLDFVIKDKIPCGMEVRDDYSCATDFIKRRLKETVAPFNEDRALKSVGTLGGGNHFIEVDKDMDGNLYIVIHSGSRYFGKQVAEYYQDLAWREIKENSVKKKISETIAKLKAEGKQKDIENTINILKMQASPISKDMCYVEGDNMENYLHDVNIARDFAHLSRKTMMDIIVKELGLHIVEEFETLHNYIDTEAMILRKGAVSAKEGEKLIIPMNMRDGSLICIGKGNPNWNCSAPHGAGRLMSRSKAKESVTMEDFEKSMEGIYSTSVVSSTIDESPMAYKPVDAILDCIDDTVEVIDQIYPIYNFKAH